MNLTVREAGLYLGGCTTRMPFRFGVSTLTFAPLATARVLVETGSGATAEGFASDLLVPKWFEKDPDKTIQDDVQTLIDSALGAAEQLTGETGARTIFDHWWTLYSDRVATAPVTETLVRGFGVSLYERALIDAACRAARRPFFEMLVRGGLGFDPGRVWPDLAGSSIDGWLPAAPARSVEVRHTIGLLDALCEDDLAEGDRVNDGLPESLEADIAAAGLSCFKIKLSGRRHDDLDRLERLAALFARTIQNRRTRGTPARFTLDGNEQFETLADLADLLDEVGATDHGANLLRGLIHIEQPLSRARTFDGAPNAAMPRLDAHAPVIIDEADGDVGAFPRAAALGYRGVSVKNCKGVFRALINRGLCARSGGRLFQSAEDLTNLPVVALQQDLATVAALGLEHVERNGHHYFRGLDHLPASEVEAALAAHGDLYERRPDGVGLRIERGRLSLGSLQCAGYGYDVPIDCTQRVPARDWRWPEAPR